MQALAIRRVQESRGLAHLVPEVVLRVNETQRGCLGMLPNTAAGSSCTRHRGIISASSVIIRSVIRASGDVCTATAAALRGT